MLATGSQLGPLAVDATFVYYFDGSVGEIRRVSKLGGAPTTLSTAQMNVVRVQVDDAHVYWATGSGIRRVSKSGGTTELVASVSQPPTFTIDATHAYWFGASGGIYRKLKDGSGAATLLHVTPQSNDLEVGATHLFWVDPLGPPLRIPKDGGTPSAFPVFLKAHLAIALDGSDVYVVDDTSGALMRGDSSFTYASTLATVPGVPLAPTLEVGKRAVFLSTTIYWTTPGVQVAKCGGAIYPPPSYDFGAPNPGLGIGKTLALDADYFYTVYAGELRRRPQ